MIALDASNVHVLTIINNILKRSESNIYADVDLSSRLIPKT